MIVIIPHESYSYCRGFGLMFGFIGTVIYFTAKSIAYYLGSYRKVAYNPISIKLAEVKSEHRFPVAKRVDMII